LNSHTALLSASLPPFGDWYQTEQASTEGAYPTLHEREFEGKVDNMQNQNDPLCELMNLKRERRVGMGTGMMVIVAENDHCGMKS
jgi:hypothetical protein